MLGWVILSGCLMFGVGFRLQFRRSRADPPPTRANRRVGWMLMAASGLMFAAIIGLDELGLLPGAKRAAPVPAARRAIP